MVLAVGGCSFGPIRPDPPPTTPSEPCPQGGIDIELGSPSPGGETAEFTTAGGTVFVAVSGFSEGGLFEPDVWQSAVYVGDAAVPPTYDEQSGQVSGVLVQAAVVEGTWGSLELEPGRYWLWATNYPDVVMRSCEPDGLSDPVPAPAP